LLTVLGAMFVCACFGCESQKKTSRKVTVEGPEKKTEVKVETTEKKKD
jgi:hypothetical protein